MLSRLFSDERFFRKGGDAQLPTWFMSALRDERDLRVKAMLNAPREQLESARSEAFVYEELINVLENGVPALATVAGTSGVPLGAGRTDFPGGPV